MIQEDRHVSYRWIEISFGIWQTSIQSILYEHLGVRKICSRCIPHNLTEPQKAGRVRKC
nr:unnamed protein product [Callosobruchus analis]